MQCMGGFCGRREACAHFHAPEIPGREPAERLCGRGDEDPQPMQRHERVMARPAVREEMAQ